MCVSAILTDHVRLTLLWLCVPFEFLTPALTIVLYDRAFLTFHDIHGVRVHLDQCEAHRLRFPQFTSALSSFDHIMPSLKLCLRNHIIDAAVIVSSALVSMCGSVWQELFLRVLLYFGVLSLLEYLIVVLTIVFYHLATSLLLFC